MTDYITQAMRTKADTYFPHLLPQQLFDDMLVDVIDASKKIELAKKALFYGKDQPELANLRSYYGSKPVPKDHDTHLRHAVMGIIGEIGELAELIRDPEKNWDWDKMMEEAGDILWYLALLFDDMETTFEEVQERNIAKLTKRYPEKFTTDLAINRDVEKEAAVFS